ncbi:hypothetical protein [Paraglaciecola sp. 2405UD69-4]|uniref:hypothetical protein n=1 Tax=Paraglaciecola sp. 2405UD69-4 TaxID=3391836 RepID=UPI0039C92B20
MVKLSQRAWNNVLIVSMLSLIMLFNLSNNFLNDDTSAEVTNLVSEGLLISTIEFANAKVERVGQGWRVETEQAITTDLGRLVELWQTTRVSLFEQSVQWEDSYPSVTVWFIGQAEPTEYQFLPLADKTLVKIASQTYQLVNVNYQMLVPTE